jgi:hypothetical protein
VSVWADASWMLDGDAELAEELVTLLADAPLGLSCDELAKRQHRRRTVVLATLRADPRFEHSGRTCGSRWQLRNRRGRDRDGTRAAELPWDELDPSGVLVFWRRA